MTPCQLQDLLVETLCREAGGTRRRWRIAVGPIKVASTQVAETCNWEVSPSGNAREANEIARHVAVLRAKHPVVVED